MSSEWPTSLLALPSNSPLRKSFNDYLVRSRVQGTLESIAVHTGSNEAKWTSQAVLRALHMMESGISEAPSTYSDHVSVKDVAEGDHSGLGLMQRQVHSEPLGMRQLADLQAHQGNTQHLTLKLHTESEDPVAHVLFESREDCVILWSAALSTTQQGRGCAEQILSHVLNALDDTRTKVFDHVDLLHEHIPLESQRSVADACTLLERLGFEKLGMDMYRHRDETSHLIAINLLPRCVTLSPADTASIRRHLTEWGYLSGSQFGDFEHSGWLPDEV